MNTDPGRSFGSGEAGPLEPSDALRVLDGLPCSVQVLDASARLIFHKPQRGAAPTPDRFLGRSIEEWCRGRGLPDSVALQRRSAFDRSMSTARPVVERERRPAPLGGHQVLLRATAALRDEVGPYGAVTVAIEVPHAEEQDGNIGPRRDGPSDEVAMLRDAVARLRERVGQLAADKRMLLSGGATGEPGPAIFDDLPGLEGVRSAVSAIDLADGAVLVAGEPGTGTRAVARRLLSADRRGQLWNEADCVDEPDRARAAIERLVDEGREPPNTSPALSGASPRSNDASSAPPARRWLFHEIAALDAESQRRLTKHAPAYVVGTSHRDLIAEVSRGTLLAELRDQLAARTIHVPALRHRGTDVEILAARLLERIAARHGRAVEPFGSRDLARLRAHLWPGNIDELRVVVERAFLEARDRRPTVRLVPGAHHDRTPPRPPAETRAGVLTEREMRRRERENLVAALYQTGWKVYGEDGAAALLGLPPTTLASRIKKLDITRSGDSA